MRSEQISEAKTKRGKQNFSMGLQEYTAGDDKPFGDSIFNKQIHDNKKTK